MVTLSHFFHLFSGPEFQKEEETSMTSHTTTTTTMPTTTTSTSCDLVPTFHTQTDLTLSVSTTTTGSAITATTAEYYPADWPVSVSSDDDEDVGLDVLEEELAKALMSQEIGRAFVCYNYCKIHSLGYHQYY